MARAVLFDFFGTLAVYEPDRTALEYPRTHALLEGWGQGLSPDEFVARWHRCSTDLEADTAASLTEVSMIEYAAAFGRACPRPLNPAEVRELAAAFGSEWRAHVRPVPGAGALLESLAGRYRLGVVSNTNDSEMVPELLADFFGEVEFDPVVLSVDHGFRKPHPSIYEAARLALGCAAADVIFVGDSYEADHLGPRTAGLAAFLIDPTRRHPVDDADRLTSLLDLGDRLA